MNAAVVPAWCLVVLALVAVPERHPWLPAMVGGLVGFFVGRLQKKSLTETPAAFLAADSALAVRAAMTSTSSGKRSLMIQWMGLIPVFAAALVQGVNLVVGVLAGYFALMLVRDLLTQSETRRLAGNKV